MNRRQAISGLNLDNDRFFDENIQMLFLILSRFSRSVISALSAISAVNTYLPSGVFSPYLPAHFAPFGSPDPKVGPARGLDLAIQTERMG